MKLNYLALAVPLFTTAIVAEYLVARKKGRNIFRFSRSIANINVGIAERLCDTLITGLFFFVYDYLHRHFAVFDIRPSILLWIVLLVVTDFTWYWYHRLAHEINIFWAAHIVHHQSEDFNYTVSARITVFQAIIRTGFWAVLPIIGFPPAMITGVLLVHGLYPFFVHTQLAGKWGILEYVLVTPSHHRVHHASNPEYLDKNYGDVFIIWDKLFGTFQKEGEPAVYGITKPLQSNSFLWQHFHYFIELGVCIKKEKSLAGKMRILFGRPSQVDPRAREHAEQLFHIHNNNESSGRDLNRYVLFQVAASLLTLFVFILFEHHLHWEVQLTIALIILLTLVNCGAILEQRRWIFYLEYVRLTIILTGIFLYHPNVTFALAASLLLTMGLYYFSTLRNTYLKWVY